jgi:hypothetical protein
MPTIAEVSVFPAEAQYQLLVTVKSAVELDCLPKYSSMTIFPSFKTMNARVPDVCKKLFRSGILDSSHPRLAGVTFSQLDPIGGKYNDSTGVFSSFLLQDKKTNKIAERK